MSVFALVGAGPSLDYCETEICELIAQKALFLLSDSVAAGFLAKWPEADAVVFTVEMRRHLYLHRIRLHTKVLAYQKCHARNLRVRPGTIVSHFKLLDEEGELPSVYSPGTVLGVMLSYSIAIAAQKGGEIHLFGVDLYYIDNQVYSRFIDPHVPAGNRIVSRETWQYEMTLKKSSGILAKSGFAIRTSFEFMQARENMRDFLNTVPASVRIIEYSPLGLDCARVEKRIPRE